MTTYNQIKKIHRGLPASDGAGVKLTRIIGNHQLPDLDPFLLLDHFGSDQADDYIAGFPAHPHRGFETVTYMLKGKMRHQDSVGNNGVIEDGGIQWMTAGKGIIHSEMPEQTKGILSGFQLWVNLPKEAKMTAPKYQENTAAEIPVEAHDNGTTIKVIAGKTKQGTTGIIENNYVYPNYWDVSMPAEAQLNEHIDAAHNAFVYVYEGQIQLADQQELNAGYLAILTPGDELMIQATDDASFIVVSGHPLDEPVERAGPFVMNTREQLQQAYADYQAGNFA
ncbi:pirin family protein [Marinicella sp. S1101]|uniref:pirin family protein n=1 Tax=Marinicella marina TaxID=2996016 RepID=UPI0022608B35|nr:pirin family protein [Marinicella marina]MCX7555070.1 pirin family protein [Marinicella marina]MDJ1141378.1 pirin family protein [Marinicella marina]